jgi:hypothetical protein
LGIRRLGHTDQLSGRVMTTRCRRSWRKRCCKGPGRFYCQRAVTAHSPQQIIDTRIAAITPIVFYLNTASLLILVAVTFSSHFTRQVTMTARDSGSGRVAGPFLYGSFIRYSLPALTGAFAVTFFCPSLRSDCYFSDWFTNEFFEVFISHINVE